MKKLDTYGKEAVYRLCKQLTSKYIWFKAKTYTVEARSSQNLRLS